MASLFHNDDVDDDYWSIMRMYFELFAYEILGWITFIRKKSKWQNC